MYSFLEGVAKANLFVSQVFLRNLSCHYYHHFPRVGCFFMFLHHRGEDDERAGFRRLYAGASDDLISRGSPYRQEGGRRSHRSYPLLFFLTVLYTDYHAYQVFILYFIGHREDTKIQHDDTKKERRKGRKRGSVRAWSFYFTAVFRMKCAASSACCLCCCLWAPSHPWTLSRV